MATTEDARAGWELYRNSGFNLTLDEINDRLKRIGHGPVAPRTHLHYRRLARRGFRRYITINRLDTMNIPDPFDDESIRSRYAMADTNVATQVVIQSGTQQIEIVGRTDALSEFSAEIVVDDTDQVQALRTSPPPVGAPVTVNFLQPSATFYGRLDDVGAIDPSQVRLTVVFGHLVPIYNIEGADVLDTATVEFVVGPGGDSPSLDEVSQDLYWLLQAHEAARGITNLLLEAITEERVVAPLPTVVRLSVASPMDLSLRTSVHVFLVMTRFASKVGASAERAKAAVEVVTKRPLVKAQVDDTRAHTVLLGTQVGDTEAHEELVRAQTENMKEQTRGLRLDNERKEVVNEVVGEVAAELIETLRSRGNAVTTRPATDPERLEPLVRELGRSLEELAVRALTMGVVVETTHPEESGPREG